MNVAKLAYQAEYQGVLIQEAHMDENNDIILTTINSDTVTIPHEDLLRNQYYTTITTTDYPVAINNDLIPKPTHCPSCGAPLDHHKDRCEYCGTEWR